MLKSSLLEIIRTFTPKELARFEDFVNSPYFNKNKNVINLFNEIKRFAPEFKDENLNKEIVWKKIFPGKEYNYGIMKNLIFDLNKLGEEYIISLNFQEDEPAQSKYLLQGLFDRYLQDYFLKKIQTARKKYDMNYFNSKNFNIEDYFHFKRVLSRFEAIYQQHFNRNFVLTESFDVLAASLISEFFTQLFKTYNNIIAESTNRKSDVRDNPVIFFLENILHGKFDLILENLKNISEEEYNVLKIYYIMFESIMNIGDVQKYLNFKQSVFNSQRYLSNKEMRNLHSCLINSYVSNPPPGMVNDIELIQIFDSMIDKNIIKVPGQKWMEEHIFSYYIIHCANLLNTDKIRSFINKYKHSINPELWENLRIEINCLLSFLDKNYEDALKHLLELELSNFGKKILSKTIKVRIFYEMNNYESFLYEKDAYNHFLSNNKNLINMPGMNENKTLSIKKIIDVVNKLFILKNEFTNEKYLDIKYTVEKDHINNYWLLEKVKEVEEANGIKSKIKIPKVKS